MRVLFSSFFLACFLAISSASASTITLLTPQAIRDLLGPYPELGTADSEWDFRQILSYQELRTKEQCDRAASQVRVTLTNLYAANNGPLSRREAQVLTAFVWKQYGETGANIALAKRLYKRPRPYVANPEVKPCIALEGSYAYPSGHTALGRVLAHILSAIYPQRREAIFARSDEISSNRVLGGVHHPSDIIAGKKLADALATPLVNSPQFQRELRRFKSGLR
jgi:acid phosphatase (class A)